MKIKSTVKVTLESPEGNAVFTFKALKMNEQLQAMTDREARKELPQVEQIKRDFAFILERLIMVEGLEDEEGKPVKAEEIKNLGLDVATMHAIAEGFWMSVSPKLKESAEKKSGESA